MFRSKLRNLRLIFYDIIFYYINMKKIVINNFFYSFYISIFLFYYINLI